MKPARNHERGYDTIRAALAKVIHLHNDFPAVLRENEDGNFKTKMIISASKRMEANKADMVKIGEKESKKICSSKQSTDKLFNKNGTDLDVQVETSEGISSITKEVILEQIEEEAESLGVEVSVAAKSLVLAQVKLLARLVQEGQDYTSDLEGLITTTSFMVARKILTTTDIGEQLLKETAFLSLPLTSLWRFTSIGVVSFEQIIQCNRESKHTRSSMVDGLLFLILYGKNEDVNISTVSEILAVVICIAYDSAKDEHASLSRFANQILSDLTSRLLTHILDSETEKRLKLDVQTTDEFSEKDMVEVMNVYELVLNNLSITSQALDRYCSSQLVQLLTHRPELQLGRVLREQDQWRSTQANATLSAWMQKLVVALGHENALNTLDLVVTNDEVNWGCVLTLVATTLNCHRAAAATLKGMIEQNIRRGCEDQEMESLVIGFLFARHASQEGRHIFPSYSQWFSAVFATESGSPVANKQSFVFLIRFLTDLVPHEPAYCLRAHLTNQIFTPKGCQEVLQDYCYLARARLQELKDTLEQGVAGRQSSTAKSKVAEEVEAAVNGFSESGKIPNFILEASIFRKPHFRSAFLPALLAPRPLPDVPDSRAKLIAALHSTGKIPSSMFSNYVEACQKEASDLLAGVFVDVQEEVIIEEPITELSNMLQDLVREATSSLDGDKVSSSAVLPTLSRISQKIEEMMKFSDSRLKNIKYLTLDARKFNAKVVSYQIIVKVIETVEKLCNTCKPVDSTRKRRPEFLSQFLSLMSSSITLQCALFTHILHSLKIGQHGELTDDEVENHGIILSELWKIEGLFLPVVGVSFPDQDPQCFIKFYLEKLEFNSHQACVFACSIMNSWLMWSIMNRDNTDDMEPMLTSLPVELLDLYCCLAPRLALIYNQGEREVTIADVYLYLEGFDVPVCSRLYFNQTYNYIQKYKIPLEKWIDFELQATWEDTPIDVRQTYLKCRVLQVFVSKEDTRVTDNTDEVATRSTVHVSIHQIVTRIFFTFLNIGLKKQNSSEILMLIQSLAQYDPNPGICLLLEWCRRDRLYGNISVLSFMSICRCLPPPLFLTGEQIFQLSGVFRNLIENLQVASQDVQLNLCDTIFLCSSVLSAAAIDGVTSIQVDQCLMPLRTAIVFHWESLRSFFRNHSAIIKRQSCLVSLWIAMTNLSKKTINYLTPDEAGLRLLAMHLHNSVCEEDETKALVSVGGGPVYTKWLLAYLGLQQMRGSVPSFPDQMKLLDIQERDKKIISICQAELDKILTTSEVVKLVNEIFPSRYDKFLALKSVPIACVFVLLCNSISSYERQTDIMESKLMINRFELLLQCHIFLCHKFDEQESSNAGEPVNKAASESHRVANSDSPDLDYLAELNQKIFSCLSKISPNTLSKLSKNTFSKCEPELKAAIKFKLQL
ncbi:uncharacterized protein [Procambarus clarkii]|nr:uncharacterized protein LOC123759433 isoform X2 [Procambarus clarkii]XP_045600460.1 uncharacterized protein LOC123759433 isoform X2 [Procambarus clarkii]XP_045600461.1 uncharacterized protein LOC123759433 isoform X2 [Procambarus clarkii]XP_045600462.1 uncharacterized protein LOC123759433 isoform X2 [Procambarus clarkii]